MTKNVTTVEPQTPAYEAARLLRTNNFGCLPVLDSTGALVGIITEADFVMIAGELLEKYKYEE